MMRAVEMYMIMAVTLMTTTLGLPQTCLHYCNFSREYSSIPKGCDCSLLNTSIRKTRSTTSKHITKLPEIKDSGIYYDPVAPRFFQNTSFDKQTLHMLNFNPIFKSTKNTLNRSKTDLISIGTDESIAEPDSYDKHDSKPSNKFKRTDSYFPKLVEETTQLPLHLYLDIDVNTSETNDDKSQLEEIKDMFENFQATEKNLSECIDLHIYIFSKYSSTINKTNTSWGRKDQHDNLSNFQQLTEVESKCDQPASIIKQSIYQIKKKMPREDKSTEITRDEQDTISTTDSYIDTIVAQNVGNESRNGSTSDMYLDTVITQPTDNDKVATEPTDMVARKIENVQSHKTYSEHDDYNLRNNNGLPDIKNSGITSTSLFYDDSTVYNQINLAADADPTDYGDQRMTSKTDRIFYNEEDIGIPRIITKELSNGTLKSVVDGYEKLPNSDFTTNSIVSTFSNQSTILNSNENNESGSNPDLLKPDIDKKVQSDIVNIHGNLYFSFGTKQVPARFIQQSDGKLDVAIDGFSMCSQMLEYNTSSFMNLLCNCIIHKNCT